LAKTADPVPPVTPVSVTTLVALPTLATPILDSGTPYVAPTATPPPFAVMPVATNAIYGFALATHRASWHAKRSRSGKTRVWRNIRKEPSMNGLTNNITQRPWLDAITAW
jgi:hypothetical protein